MAVQDAKYRFSEIMRRARCEGPQGITLRGERAAVVLSAAVYDALCAAWPSLAGPAWDDDLATAVEQSTKTPGRDISV